MSDDTRPHFDPARLHAAAGERSYARGEAYFKSAAVELLGLDRSRVLARVRGTEPYRTEVTLSGDRIGGNCSCPAFVDWGFCKHMVAAALTANAADPGSAAGPSDEGEPPLSRIRSHLQRQSTDRLVEIIMRHADRDMALLRRLDLAAAIAEADDGTLRDRLQSAIDEVTEVVDFIEYGEASEWAAGPAEVMDTLADLLTEGRAELVRELALYAIDRLSAAVGSMDDSNGHGIACLERARTLHFEACRAAPLDPVELARTLFERETKDIFGTFHNAAGVYEDLLGERGLAEYQRLATDAWERLPTRVAGDPRQGYVGGSTALFDILDRFAERRGDQQARIELRTKDLSSPGHYQRLAQFCREHGRTEEALNWAQEGLWLFEDRSRELLPLVQFTAELLQHVGRLQEAVRCLWQAFETLPGERTYRDLRGVADETVREQAIAVLRRQAAEGGDWPWQRPADPLIRIFLDEGRIDEAWAVLREVGGSGAVQEQLAQASERTHPQDALAIYQTRVEELADHGGNENYDAVRALLDRMAALRDSDEQAAYVADLKARHKRKRNLMKRLE